MVKKMVRVLAFAALAAAPGMAEEYFVDSTATGGTEDGLS